jgi:nucleoside-diphosphate-sugar epimerase
MRIFLTGATGFLGSQLVRDLVAHEQEVIALVRPGADTRHIADVCGHARLVEGTLDDMPSLKPLIASVRPNAVAHLAWWGVGNMHRNDVGQARNIPQCVELAEAAAEAGAEIFVGAGSQAEYGIYDRAIREDDEERPTTLYGHAKVAARRMTAWTCANRGMRFAWLRVFSTYGPGAAEYWLFPNTIRSLKQGKRMALTGGEQRWGFLHVTDAAAAFRAVLLNQAGEGVFNVGSPDAPRLRDTLSLLRDMVDPAAELGFGDVPYRPDQVMLLQADVQRLSQLGWRPTVTLEEGLRALVAAYAPTSDI